MELSPVLWIIIGVAIVVVIAILLIAFGLRRQKSKQVSFEKKEELEQKKPSSGNYQAKSGFDFTSGGGKSSETTNIGGVEVKDATKRDKVAEPRSEKPAGKTVGKPADKGADKPAEEPTAKPVARPASQTETPATEHKGTEAKAGDEQLADKNPSEPTKTPGEEKPTEPQEPVEREDVAKADKTGNAAGAGAAAVGAAGVAGAAGATAADAPAESDQPEAPVESAKPSEPTEPTELTEPTEPTEPAETAAPSAPAAEAAPSAPSETEASRAGEQVSPQEAQETAATEEIAPVEGRMGKLRARMSKSQNVIGKGVLGILSAGDLDEDAWEEIEDTLLMADLGTAATMKVVDDLRERIAMHGVSSEEEARGMLRAALIDACKPDMDRSIKAMPYDGKPAVIMVVGVNGTGKTTTTGKLSRVLIGMGHSVTLGAADTFRAAAADQLETWGRRVGAKTVRGPEGADPASVAFDAVAKGIDDSTDVVLIDTAGRLHTSVGLMDQLGKVKRVVEKKAKVDEVLLVLDATVGQNGLMQARVFREVVDISGVVLTKLDGTAKGGIVFQVQEELGVPVKLVGLGEGEDHLAPFEVESFVDALLG